MLEQHFSGKNSRSSVAAGIGAMVLSLLPACSRELDSAVTAKIDNEAKILREDVTDSSSSLPDSLIARKTQALLALKASEVLDISAKLKAISDALQVDEDDFILHQAALEVLVHINPVALVAYTKEREAEEEHHNSCNPRNICSDLMASLSSDLKNNQPVDMIRACDYFKALLVETIGDAHYYKALIHTVTPFLPRKEALELLNTGLDICFLEVKGEDYDDDMSSIVEAQIIALYEAAAHIDQEAIIELTLSALRREPDLELYGSTRKLCLQKFVKHISASDNETVNSKIVSLSQEVIDQRHIYLYEPIACLFPSLGSPGKVLLVSMNSNLDQWGISNGVNFNTFDDDQWRSYFAIRYRLLKENLVIRVVMDFPTEDRRELLENFLDDPNPTMRVKALFELANDGDPVGEQRVLSYLHTLNDRGLSEFASAYTYMPSLQGLLRPEFATAIAETLLANTNPDVRTIAFEFIGELPNADIISIVQRYINDPSPKVREVCINAGAKAYHQYDEKVQFLKATASSETDQAVKKAIVRIANMYAITAEDKTALESSLSERPNNNN